MENRSQIIYDILESHECITHVLVWSIWNKILKYDNLSQVIVEWNQTETNE
jgi:hypothetical protein